MAKRFQPLTKPVTPAPLNPVTPPHPVDFDRTPPERFSLEEDPNPRPLPAPTVEQPRPENDPEENIEQEKVTTTTSDDDEGFADDEEEEIEQVAPPKGIEPLKSTVEIQETVWRALLHLESLEGEIQLLLATPAVAGQLRTACALAACQMTNHAKDWRPIATVRNILHKMKE